MEYEVDRTLSASEQFMDVVRKSIPEFSDMDKSQILKSANFLLQNGTMNLSDTVDGIYQRVVKVKGIKVSGFTGEKLLTFKPAILSNIYPNTPLTGSAKERVDLTLIYAKHPLYYQYYITEKSLIDIAELFDLPSKLFTNNLNYTRCEVLNNEKEKFYYYNQFSTYYSGECGNYRYTEQPTLTTSNSVIMDGNWLRLNDLISKDEGIYRFMLGFKRFVTDSHTHVGSGSAQETIYVKKAIDINGDILFEDNN